MSSTLVEDAATARQDRGALSIPCLWADLGRVSYDSACQIQRDLSARRKEGKTADHLLLVEHPHVITLGRNADDGNVLVPRERLAGLGIELCETNRGGDVTYHGPGQLVGYPILDLRDWKRDVIAYIRSLEQALIDTVAAFGVRAGRVPGATGIWAGDAKLAAIGVHLSRWVTTHGFALNVSTDLNYFGHIIPCGLHKPVTSLERLLGQAPAREDVIAALVRCFGAVFDRRMEPSAESFGEPWAALTKSRLP